MLDKKSHSIEEIYTKLIENAGKYNIVINHDEIKVARFDILQLDNNVLQHENPNSFHTKRVEEFCRKMEEAKGARVILTGGSAAYLVSGCNNENFESILKEVKEKQGGIVYTLK